MVGLDFLKRCPVASAKYMYPNVIYKPYVIGTES